MCRRERISAHSPKKATNNVVAEEEGEDSLTEVTPTSTREEMKNNSSILPVPRTITPLCAGPKVSLSEKDAASLRKGELLGSGTETTSEEQRKTTDEGRTKRDADGRGSRSIRRGRCDVAVDRIDILRSRSPLHRPPVLSEVSSLDASEPSTAFHERRDISNPARSHKDGGGARGGDRNNGRFSQPPPRESSRRDRETNKRNKDDSDKRSEDGSNPFAPPRSTSPRPTATFTSSSRKRPAERPPSDSSTNRPLKASRKSSSRSGDRGSSRGDNSGSGDSSLQQRRHLATTGTEKHHSTIDQWWAGVVDSCLCWRGF